MATAFQLAAPQGLAARLPCYLLVAALPFLDFVQTGLTSFSTPLIMGDLGAGPEEFSLAAVLYAVVAVTVIAAHRLLVDAAGWRVVMAASGGSIALGALVTATSSSFDQFLAGRILMAAGAGPSLTAGRVLINHLLPPHKRFVGIKFFASGIAWGAVAGPLLGAAMAAVANWRAGFAVLVVPAAFLCGLAWWQLDGETTAPAQRGSWLPLAAVAASAGLVFWALQRATFSFFGNRTGLLAALAIACVPVAVFLRTQSRRGANLLDIEALRQRRFAAGLAVFALGYLILGADNTVLPVLLARVMNLPLDWVGLWLAAGALGGVASWIALARLLPRYQGPYAYYAAGFLALAVAAWDLSGLSESVHPAALLPALVLHGVFLITVLSTTAMQAFARLQHSVVTLSHANQAKNMVAQVAIAAGVAMANLCLQQRSAHHFVVLGEHLSAGSAAFADAMQQLERHFALTLGAPQASQMALAQVAQWVGQEASLLATLDYFRAVAMLAAGCAACAAGLWLAGSVRGGQSR